MDDASHIAVSEESKKRLPSFDLPSVGINWLRIALIAVGFSIFWQWVNSPMLVTVTGVGEVDVPVSNATVTLAVSTNNSNATEAIKSVETKAVLIKDLLVRYGIAEGDLRISQVSVTPISTQSGLAYQAIISMGAKVDDHSKAADLVAVLYANGADYVSQPVLSVEDQKAAEKQALEKALQDAKKQAGDVGFKQLKFIRKVVGITHSPTGASSTITADQTDTNTISADPAIAAASTNSIKVQKAVSVSYKMW